MPQLRTEYAWRQRALSHSSQNSDSFSKRMFELLEKQPIWMAQAHCKFPKLRHWFELPSGIRSQEKKTKVEVAKGICSRCPVLNECESWAESIQKEAISSRRWPWTDIVVAGKYYPGKNQKDIGETND